MFTGLVEETGKFLGIKRGHHGAVITIEASKILEGLKLGDSIAVNGTCLTIVDFTKRTISADIMPETWERCSMSQLKIGERVNLERAMAANGRFGGHIVSGHIDGVGIIKRIQKEDNAVWYTIEAKEKILHYIVEKGSIAIDGISLTVAKVEEKTFFVSVIPHTISNTNLWQRQVGDIVNLENDCIVKYVEKFLLHSKQWKGDEKKKTITATFLKEHGF